jgi:hypothetical protein
MLIIGSRHSGTHLEYWSLGSKRIMGALEFQASLGNPARPSLKTKNQKNNNRGWVEGCLQW